MSEGTRIPCCMSTQHPDNVTVPFFAPGVTMGGDDEVTEAFYAYSHLGCDEQMWDAEGTEVDAFVVEKLLAAHADFFRAHPLGEDVFLTPRVPNPAAEPAQAKILPEVLDSLPRHSDIARLFHERERPPILEVIFPMTTSAADLERVRRYYGHPAAQDRERPEAADAVVGAYLRDARPASQRVFIARSDPALNYAFAAAVVLALTALERLADLERARAIAIYPILGAGGAPFRGNLRAPNVAGVLRTYPSVQTFTIQSAFKYDYPAPEVAAGIAGLRGTRRASPVAIIDDPHRTDVLERAIEAYRGADGSRRTSAPPLPSHTRDHDRNCWMSNRQRTA